MNTRLAQLISTIFGPVASLTAVGIIAVLRSVHTIEGLVMQTVFVFGAIALTTIARWVLLKRGFIKDWDIRDRSRRPPLLTALFLIIGVYTYVFHTLLAPQVLELFFLFLLWLIGFLLITTQWKISGHTGGSALAIGLIIIWYGNALWPLAVITGLVA